MTSSEVLISYAVNNNPAKSIALSNIPDAVTKPPHCLPESLPSPPESWTKPAEQNRIANAYLASTSPAETPDPSPTSRAQTSEAGAGRIIKRVDFSPWTASSNCTDQDTSIRSLPPSRECQSSKSILKQTRPLPVQERPSDQPDDPAMMLSTILQQLSTADRHIRLDAYSTLCSALKAYAELPNGQITSDKIQALLAHIKTDVTREMGQSLEPTETNLILQALKLVVIIVWNKSLSVYLTDSDRSFLIDHSTHILQERKTPKAILLHYLHLLSTQEFSSRIMTTSRAIRILEALKDLSEHVKGNGVVSERIMVYQRILDQASGALRSRHSCWATQLLDAMTCQVFDTRKKAVALGRRIAAVLGPSSTVATSLRDLLDASGDQEVLSSTICKRLMKMMKSTHESREVPSIWAVVMLLLRGLGQKFHEWPHLHDWLRVIQKCFNCSDSAVRISANKAWSKLVCVAAPYNGKESFLTKMLIKPISAQLERPTNDKPSKDTRYSAFAAYCNLLYYALKPSATFGHYDTVWDQYIASLFEPSFLSSEENSDRACRILTALFWSEKVSPWRDNRALDAALVEPEELPPLDRQWVRARCRSILDVFELLFKSSCWGTAAYPGTAYISIAWRNFARALSDACRKEVIPSAATVESMSHVMNFLGQICQQGPASLKGDDGNFIRRFHFICKTTVSEIGPIPFMQEAGSGVNNGHHTSKTGKKGTPPVFDLLRMLQELPHSCDDKEYSHIIFDLLHLVSKAHSSPKSRIRFYRQTAQALLPDQCSMPRQRLTWTAIARLAKREMPASNTSRNGENNDAEEVAADVEKILHSGVPYQEGECEDWCALLKQALQHASGCDRRRSRLVERLTTPLRNAPSDQASLCTALVIQEFLRIPLSLKVFDNGTTSSKKVQKQRDEVVLAYWQVVSNLDKHLSRMYGFEGFCNELVLKSVVDAALSLLQQDCPTGCRSACLLEMQESLAVWLQDEQRLMTTATLGGSFKLGQARRLCPIVIDVLGMLNKEIDLVAFDKIFAAGFKTTHKITINQMVKMWNSTYGKKDSLEYGDMLKEAVTRLIPFVDLELPGLDHLKPHELSSPTMNYLDSLEDEEMSSPIEEIAAAPEVNHPEVNQLLGLPSTDAAVRDKHSRTPNTGRLKARLRHDDSQINFVSIESSPPREGLESQDLTARQKEVRERQDREAALLFPDLRSSPVRQSKPSSSSTEASSLVIAGDDSDVFETANPATPTLPPQQDIGYDEAAQLSPTPKSKHQALRLEDIEFPSSPLSMPGPANEVNQAATPTNVQFKEVCTTVIEIDEDLDLNSSAVENDIEVVDAQQVETSSSKASADPEESHDQMPLVEGCSGLEEQTPMSVEDMPDRAGDDVSSENNALRDPTNIANAEIIYNELASTSPESPEGVDFAGTFRDAEPTGEVTGTKPTPQTDGINEKHTENTVGMPINTAAPPEELMPNCSDDNDFWSASQLSQDLERAASSVPSPNFQENADSFSPPTKRKMSTTPRGSKRRKTIRDTTQSRESPRAPSITPEQHSAEVIYDCIEVEVESPSLSQQSSQAASTVSQASGVASQSKRGRGRPRKVQPEFKKPNPPSARRSLDEISGAGSLDATSKLEVCVPAREDELFGPKECSGVTGNSDRVLNPAGAANRPTTSQRGSMDMKMDGKENQASPEEAMELLQRALSTLKKTSMGRCDLRAIDDLVFDIRVEAQNAAQRRGKSDT